MRKSYAKNLALFFAILFSGNEIFSQNIAVNTSGTAAAATNMFEVTQGSATNNTVGIFSKHNGAATNAYAIWAEATGATNNYAIVVPPTGGNVGIGTITPSVKLHVSGSADESTEIRAENTNGTGINAAGVLRAAADVANIFIASHGSGKTGVRYGLTLGGYSEITNWSGGNGLIIGTLLAKPLIFGTNGLERMRIDNAGNVGIGAAPGSRLDVQGGNLTVGTLYGTYVMKATLGSFDTRATNPWPETYNVGVVNEFKANASNGLSDGGSYNSVLSVRQWSSGTDWSGGGVHQLGFTENGNLWQRYSETTGAWGAWNKLLTAGNGGVTTTCATVNYIPKMSTASNIACSQIFDNGTNVGIGTATPTSKLHVYGNTGVDIRLEDAAVANAAWRILPQTGNTTKLFRIYDATAALDRMVIDASGNVGIGTTVPGTKLQVGGYLTDGRANGIQLGDAANYKYNLYQQTAAAAGVANSMVLDANGDVDYRQTVGTNNGSGNIVFMTGGGTAIGGTGASEEKMRINYLGNVGIGTTAPGSLLHLQSANTLDVPRGDLVLSRYWASAADTRASSIFHYYNSATATDNLAFGVAGNGGTNGQPNVLAQIKMLVQANGNVGIGTTAPGAKLHVASATTGRQIAAGSWAWADISSNTSGYGFFGGNMYTDHSPGAYKYSETHGSIGAMAFAVNYPTWNKASVITSGTTSSTAGNSFTPSVIATFDYTGNVGIGTTTPSGQLHVQRDQNAKTRLKVVNSTAGTSATAEVFIQRADANIISIGIGDPTYNVGTPIGFTGAYLWSGAPEGIATRADGGPIRFITLSGASVPTEYMRVANGGNVGIRTTTPAYPLSVNGDASICGTLRYTSASAACSDIRYKKDILTLSNSLNNVMKLQGVNYHWKKDEFPDKQFSDDTQIGFIAQEIEKIYPEVVITDKDGYKSVDYSRLTPILVEAMKEQQKMIDSLKSEVLGLKSENKTLKSDYDARLKKVEQLLGSKAEK